MSSPVVVVPPLAAAGGWPVPGRLRAGRAAALSPLLVRPRTVCTHLVWLYRTDLARLKRTLTPAQEEALDRTMAARQTCPPLSTPLPPLPAIEVPRFLPGVLRRHPGRPGQLLPPGLARYTPHDFRRMFETETVTGGYPFRIAGHAGLAALLATAPAAA